VIVSGSAVLIGGDPGVGKSTLLLQAIDAVVRKAGGTGLYVSAEESQEQIKIRAERMGIFNPDVLVLSETKLETIIERIEALKPVFVVIDSIQTIYTEALDGAPGTVSQVRETSSRLTLLAKSLGVPVFIIGHVTKEGTLAGPRVLEHVVDTVLYFEGDRDQAYRILRAVKNRFGPTNEIGVFEMTDSGLREVSNPSEIFLSEHTETSPGTALTVTLEGTRPLVVEIQALVSPTVFGMPRRTSIGVDINRVNLLIAVLEKVGGLSLGVSDVYVNVVGGLRIYETAVDLAVLASIVSSFWGRPLPERTVFIGEVGLTGEVRKVHQALSRLKEAEKIGIKRCVLPEGALQKDINTVDVIFVRNLAGLIEILREDL
jgi:DNA repair protein RadA/Sms